MPKVNKSLVGGSEGEPESNSAHPFFFPEVKALQLLSKNTYGLRLLPAYDKAMLEAGDENYKLSVAPYRDRDNIDSSNDLPKFTAWYYVVTGYKFVGNDGKHFLSPLTLHSKAQRGIDPLFDIFFTAKNSGNPDWVKLTVKPATTAEGYQSVIPLPKRFGIANAVVSIEKTQTVENRVIVFGSMALDMLKATLNTMRPAVVASPVDPEWSDYLFGDVTSPAYGAWATIKKTVFNTAGMADAGFHFSSKANQLVGYIPWPVELASDWGQAYLAGRLNIGDTDKVTRIWSAEEELEYLVSDDFLPYELIEAACKNHWTVPAASGNPSYSTPPEDDGSGGQFGPVPKAPVAPVAPRATGAPVAPKAPAAPPRVAAPGASAPRTAAPAAAPKVAAPGALPPRPAAPGGASRPPGIPGGAPRPPAGGPAKLPPRVAAPVAAAPATPAPVAAEVPALTQEEVDEFNALQAAFDANQESLTAEQVNRFGELGERVALQAQQQ